MVEQLERRLASVIVQAFDDSTTIQGRLKLLDSFEGLLLRDGLSTALDRKLSELLLEYLHDMHRVRDIFLQSIKAFQQGSKVAHPNTTEGLDFFKAVQQVAFQFFSNGIDSSPIMRNGPPRAGAIYWIRGLLERVKDPMRQIRGMGTIRLDTEAFKRVESAYEIVSSMLLDSEDEFVREWEAEMSRTSDAKLRMTLLIKDARGELHVNFDPTVVCMLRETKYFLALGMQIPDNVSHIYKNEDTYRIYTANLEMVANMYNSMIRNLLDVERPLILPQMEQVEQCLQKGMRHINWKSHSISDFVSQATAVMTEAHSVVNSMKSNLSEIQKLALSWSFNPIVERRSTRTYLPSEIADLQSSQLRERFSSISVGGDLIQNYIANTQKVLRANFGSAQFKTYLDYINGLLLEGMVQASVVSCQHLLEQIDPIALEKGNIAPLIEIQLLLNQDTKPPQLRFSPQLSLPKGARETEHPSVRSLLLGWIKQVCSIGSLLHRIDSPDVGGDYLTEVQDDLRIQAVVSQISKLLSENEKRCAAFRGICEDYAYLWCEDIEESYSKFLVTETLPGQRTPPLQSFALEVNTYRALEDEIRSLAGSTVLGWVKIDIRPFKGSLLALASKWRDRFQQYPLKFVQDTVNDALVFINSAMTGLEVETNGTDSLLLVFAHLRDIRKNADRLSSTLEPLKLTMSMLMKYGIKFPHDVQIAVDTACTQWENLKRRADVVKASEATFQASEALAIKESSKYLMERVISYRKIFQSKMPFEFLEDCNIAYDIIDQLHHGHNEFGSLLEISHEVLHLNELQDCFELEMVQFNDVDSMLAEARSLKHIWDAVSIAVMTNNVLKAVRWSDIQMEYSLQSAKELDALVNKIPDDEGSWSVVQALKQYVTNLNKSLILVNNLQNSYLRSRHWKQLMRITGMSFTIDEKFSLGDMLALQLHSHEKAILELVDKAGKEFEIEKKLDEIQIFWKPAELKVDDQSAESENEYLQFCFDCNLIKRLEEDINLLQLLQTSGLVHETPTFLENIADWQKILGILDDIILKFFSVQRKFRCLYGVFVQSLDVRNQLPEDAIRFDMTIENWKSIASQIVENPLILQVFGDKKKIDVLDLILADLEKCESALQILFETKRQLCPRFYFFSSEEMLQILFGVNDHRKLCILCRPCFPNISNFEYLSTFSDIGTGGSVTGIFGENDEFVAFVDPFEILGSKVESWLQQLISHIQQTIRVSIQNALLNYSDGARQLVTDCFAQVVHVHLNISFSTEIERILGAFEQGIQGQLRDYNEMQMEWQNNFVELVSSQSQKRDRFKFGLAIIIKSHNQEVLQLLMSEIISSKYIFIWQTHLKYFFHPANAETTASIGMHEYHLGDEYIGGRDPVVITPLTDRCYFAFSQAMHMNFGCIVAGDRGTGKTEMVRGFARALSMLFYSYTGSSDMDVKGISNLFKGMAQTGAWICFDAATRISSSVLSIISTNFCVFLEATRANTKEVTFGDELVNVIFEPTASLFLITSADFDVRYNVTITVRKVFRPLTLLDPGLEAIIEIKLLSEGFIQSKALTNKLISCKRFCEDLLSKEAHYKWSLPVFRAIISSAADIIAMEKESTAEEVFCKVISNTFSPWLLDDDIPIFRGILRDVFPSFNFISQAIWPAKSALEASFLKALIEKNLQVSDIFRAHSKMFLDAIFVSQTIFVIGPTGSGKTEIISSTMQFLAASFDVVNPKSIPTKELVGWMELSGWKDGIIPKLLKSRSDLDAPINYFLIFDGDIDGDWMDSIHSTMDCSQVLNLGNCDRIPFPNRSRLLFETSALTNAAPGTVSKGSLVFIQYTDTCLISFLESWIQSRETELERNSLRNCFFFYVPSAVLKTRVESVMSDLSDLNRLMTTCAILEGFLAATDELFLIFQTAGQAEYQKTIESLVSLAAVWGLGGTCSDRGSSHSTFDKIWRESFNRIPFPENGTVFDFVFSFESSRFVTWKSQMTLFSQSPGQFFNDIYVPSVETLPLLHISGQLIQNKFPVMFVGPAGTGKTSLFKEKLRTVDQYMYSTSEISLNYFSDSLSLQTFIERGLVKKSSKILCPAGMKRMIYLVDDINMPSADKYNTQQALALLKELMEYGIWYDRADQKCRMIKSIQFCSCMNPNVGSFDIDPRLARKFCTFLVWMPSDTSLFHIYSSITMSHFHSFDKHVQSLATGRLIDALLNIFGSMKSNFQALGGKSHYLFNMRNISNVVQGLCRVSSSFCSDQQSLIVLWMHEVDRVFGDILISSADIRVFQKFKNDICLKWFDDIVDIEKISTTALLFSSFYVSSAGGQRPYCRVTDQTKLLRTIEDRLGEYNSSNPTMTIHLFDQTVSQICRITRIIDKPCGHILLVGMDGVGKESLAKLSAFICGFEICSAQVIIEPRDFTRSDFETHLKQRFVKCGLEAVPSALIITSTEVLQELFLISIHSFLSTTDLSIIFTPLEEINIVEKIRPIALSSGRIDTRESCWELFTANLKENLHICLCFGLHDTVLHESFLHLPAICKHMSFNYVFPWSQDELVSTASNSFPVSLEVNGISRESVCQHMAYVHSTVLNILEECKEKEGMSIYAPPKVFVNFVMLFSEFVNARRAKLENSRVKLCLALERLNTTAELAAQLHNQLVDEMQLVQEKMDLVNNVNDQIKKEKESAEEERSAAGDDETKAELIASEVARLRKDCDDTVAASEPILAEAQAGLITLDKKSLTELKSMVSPPPGVEDVVAAVTVLLNRGHIPKDLTWNTVKKIMNNAEALIKQLKSFDRSKITESAYNFCQRTYLCKDGFNTEKMKSKSIAAAGMCGWVINICRHFHLMQELEPKRKLLTNAVAKLDEFNSELSGVRSQMAAIDLRLNDLELQCQAAKKESTDAQNAAELTKQRIELAERLIQILSKERIDWSEKIVQIDTDAAATVGDALVATAFATYAGAFGLLYRARLLRIWIPDLNERRIRMTSGVVPVSILAEPALIAQWNSRGLPTEELHVQNAAILTQARGWPLIIDPHNQCSVWLKIGALFPPTPWNISIFGDHKFDRSDRSKTSESSLDETFVASLNDKNWVQTLKQALSIGATILLCFFDEKIDEKCFDNLLAQKTTKRGKSQLILIMGVEIDLDPNFRLILYTQQVNPHFKSKIFAQTQIVNFAMTKRGTEEHFLSMICESEMPEVFKRYESVLSRINELKVNMKNLENDILMTCASVEGELLSNSSLIEQLDVVKCRATSLCQELEESEQTVQNLRSGLFVYKPISDVGVMMFSLMESLWRLSSNYRFSLASIKDSFLNGLHMISKIQSSQAMNSQAMNTPEPSKSNEPSTSPGSPSRSAGSNYNAQERVRILQENIRISLFRLARMALSARHRLPFAIDFCFQVSLLQGNLHPDYVNYILDIASGDVVSNPMSDCLSDDAWGKILALEKLSSFKIYHDGYKETIKAFEGLSAHVLESAKRFREWYESERPEETPLPLDKIKLGVWEKLLIIRALRPDRIINAFTECIRLELGADYLFHDPEPIESTFPQITSTIPLLIFLDSGPNDEHRLLTSLQKHLNEISENNELILFNMERTTPVEVEAAKHEAMRSGHWLFISNFHLHTKLDVFQIHRSSAESVHNNFRLILSSNLKVALPIDILRSCLKWSFFQPTGIKATLSSAFIELEQAGFLSHHVEDTDLEVNRPDFKTALLAFVLLHTLLVHRSQYGSMGWSMPYRFCDSEPSTGAQVLTKFFLSRVGLRGQIPWADLQVVCGGWIYGGVIATGFDLLVLNASLDTLFSEEFVHGDSPFSKALPDLSISWKEIQSKVLSTDWEACFSILALLPSSKISQLRADSDDVMKSICILLRDRESFGTLESLHEKTIAALDDISEKLPALIDLQLSSFSLVEERSPFSVIFSLESRDMNRILLFVRKSLTSMTAAVDSKIQMSPQIDLAVKSILMNQVPIEWEKRSYPSLYPLASWVLDLARRVQQLDTWARDMSVPRVTWLSGLLHPRAFLAAITQSAARTNEWRLEDVAITVEVTKKAPEDVSIQARDGAYIYGLYLEGARWDSTSSSLEELKGRSVISQMPVLLVKAVPRPIFQGEDAYRCPVYRTLRRVAENVIFMAGLPSLRHPPLRWVLAGVALLAECDTPSL